jgi:hypothetical protein
LALSTIEVLDAAARPAYKTNQLKYCLSTPTLQAVLSAGITAVQLENHEEIINLLRTRCNAGRNRHVWRHQFAICFQLPNQSADNWLCSLCDISRKCETSQLKAASLQQNDHAINAIRRSAYKSSKSPTCENKQTRFAPDKKSLGRTSAPCRYCGGPRRHGTTQCPAFGKSCDNCGKDNHFASVCESEPKNSTKTRHAPHQVPKCPHQSYLIYTHVTAVRGAKESRPIVAHGRSTACVRRFVPSDVRTSLPFCFERRSSPSENTRLQTSIGTTPNPV